MVKLVIQAIKIESSHKYKKAGRIPKLEVRPAFVSDESSIIVRAIRGHFATRTTCPLVFKADTL